MSAPAAVQPAAPEPPPAEPPPAEPIAAGPLTQHVRWRIGTRAYGVIFLVVVGLLLGLSIASFQKRFTPVVMVTLETTRTGSQLQETSDVKLRGMIVGEVRTIEATHNGTRLGLALNPDEVSKIPANVSARLLQKTLFGERYVDLVTDPQTSRPIREGDTIRQDRSTVGIELEAVFDNLYPLLRAVQPGKLATTLNAVSTSLEGRGDQLGEHLEILDAYLKAINPKMPVIQRDITLLGDTLDVYNAAAPDFFRLTESLRTTNKTIVEKDRQLAAFLVGTAGFANTTAGFLRDNEQRIIQVGRVTRPTTQLLAKYSPNYPCFASALVNWLPRADETFGSGMFHITLEVVPPRAAYRPGEEPQHIDKRGPNCAGLPMPQGSQSHPYQPPPPRDGSQPAREVGPLDGILPSAIPSAFVRQLIGVAGPGDSGTAGSVEEQQLVAALLSPDDASRPSGIQTLLAGPVLRGTVVSNR